MFLERFFPDEYYNSTYDIDFEALYESGVRGLIFDIDNTLVPHGAPADERSKELFSRLRDIGMKCMLLSNNRETYDRTKIEHGVLLACHKRPIPAERITGLVDEVETEIFNIGER